MEDLFNNVKFGDRFITRDGNILMFHRYTYHGRTYHQFIPLPHFIEENTNGEIITDEYGRCINEFPNSEDYDIVAKYKKELSPEEEIKILNQSIENSERHIEYLNNLKEAKMAKYRHGKLINIAYRIGYEMGHLEGYKKFRKCFYGIE